MTATDDLEPIHPDDARELYLNARTDISQKTERTHDKRITRFVNWCEAQDIENLNTLTGRRCHRYKIESFAEKENGGEYSEETIRGYIDTLRVFLQFCVTIDAVDAALPEKVQSPRPENSRTETLEAEQATSILASLHKYDYASIRHLTLTLMWQIGLRVGAIHSLDVSDYDPATNRLHVTHQPHQDTALKNGWDGERIVAISDSTAELIEDYLAQHRHDVTDDHGRRPLITSKQGRRSITSLREIIYNMTKPCEFADTCPHDRDPSDCEATQRREWASKCPSTVSPHPIRRGAITNMLRNGVPKAVVSDRCDVSSDTLDEHYNQLEADERAERRRDYLDDAFDAY